MVRFGDTPMKPIWHLFRSALRPPAPDKDDGIAYWRNLILFFVLMGLSLLGMTAYLPSVALAIREGLWGIVFVDTVVFAAVIALFLDRRLSFPRKSACLLFIFFGLGAWLLAELGPFSAGSLWLFTFSVMTGVLLGLKPAAIATGINAVTIAAIGFLMVTGRLNWGTHLPHPVALWFVIGANFIFLNTIAAISIAVLGKGLEQALEKERNALTELEVERQQLIDANRKLTREIAERKRAQEEKEKLEKQLQVARKMEAMGTLAGGIAHDFNNILASILGYTELSLVEISKKEKLRANLVNLRDAAERARDLVRQILTFSSRGEKYLSPIKLSVVVKEALRHFRAGAARTVEIREQLDCEENILGDPGQMHQVVLNLCTNGAHALDPEGGFLEIELKKTAIEPSGLNTVAEPAPGTYLRLSVRDNGHGIPQELMERIFDPFFTTKPPGKGTGMGLAVVHGIVKTHGGALTVDSRLGKGSTFKVWLPVFDGDPVNIVETDTPLPNGTETVLLVDDESAVEEVAKHMLRLLGYRVDSRPNGLDALALFRKKPDLFDLVITDMFMPEMTGDMLAKEVLKVRSDIPVMIMTGFSDTMTDREARKIGVRKLLMKPLNLREFALTIREVLDA